MVRSGGACLVHPSTASGCAARRLLLKAGPVGLEPVRVGEDVGGTQVVGRCALDVQGARRVLPPECGGNGGHSGLAPRCGDLSNTSGSALVGPLGLPA